MKKTENNYSAVKARQSRKTRKSRRSYSPSQLLSGLNKAINKEVDTPEQSEYDDPDLTKFIEISDLVWAKKDAKSKQMADIKQINLNVPNENSKIPERSSSNREPRANQVPQDIRRSNSAKPILKDQIKQDNLKIINEVSKKPSKNQKVKPKLQVPRLYANQPQKIEQPIPFVTESKSTVQNDNAQFSQEYKILVKKLKKYLIIFTVCIVIFVIIGIVLSIVLSVVINNSCLVKKCASNLTDDGKGIVETTTQKIQSTIVTSSEQTTMLSTRQSTMSEIEPTEQKLSITSTQTKMDKICDYGFSGTDCQDECGKSFVQPNVKIVGGIEAVPKSWPWTALIYFKYRTEQSGSIVVYYCGGTLIDRVTVLTAAHCIFDTIFYINKLVDVVPNKYFPTKESMYKVYLGVHDRTMIDFTQNIEPAIAVNVAKIIKHEEYSSENELNDIAILKLERYVELNENIQVACLPRTNQKYPIDVDIPAWVMGWGALSYGGQASFKLRNVKINVYDGSFCSDVIKNYQKNWSSQICAGDITGGKDSCQGDSGNSLFVTDLVNDKQKYVAIGIVSYGERCGLINKPGVYTRISYFLNWIKKHSG